MSSQELYLSRVVLRPTPRNRLPPACLDAGDHALVWSFFPSDPHPRDFLFRREGGPVPRYYILSQRRPVDRSGLWAVETKQYDPQLRAGQVLSFALRANPCVRSAKVRTAGGHAKRHDVAYHTWLKVRSGAAPASPGPKGAALLDEIGGFDQVPVRDDEGARIRWLESRAARLGFSVTPGQVFVEGHNREVIPHGEDAPIQQVVVDYAGKLTVEDPALLARAIQDGIGPGRAFGCGLLLVKRAP